MLLKVFLSEVYFNWIQFARCIETIETRHVILEIIITGDVAYHLYASFYKTDCTLTRVRIVFSWNIFAI
jgi:hypothetical protein